MVICSFGSMDESLFIRSSFQSQYLKYNRLFIFKICNFSFSQFQFFKYPPTLKVFKVVMQLNTFSDNTSWLTNDILPILLSAISSQGNRKKNAVKLSSHS